MRYKLIGLVLWGGLSWAHIAAADVFTEDVVTNGDFTNDLSNWSTLNVDRQNNLLDQYPVSGQFLTLGHLNEIEAVRQEVTIPADAGLVTLTMYYRFFPETADAGDYLRISVGSVSETIQAVDGSIGLWSEYSLDASAMAGQTVTLEVLVKNNSASLTFADIDIVSLTAQSYAELIGTVKDKAGHGLRNAAVTIRNHHKTVVWSGITNKKGKFIATGLRGSSKSYKVKITKNDLHHSFNLRLVWATIKKRTFVLN